MKRNSGVHIDQTDHMGSHVPKLVVVPSPQILAIHKYPLKETNSRKKNSLNIQCKLGSIHQSFLVGKKKMLIDYMRVSNLKMLKKVNVDVYAT